MKKILLIATLAVIMLSGCSKSEEFCWDCTLETRAMNISTGIWSSVNKTKDVVCGMNESGARAYENEFYNEWTDGIWNYVRQMKCERD